MTSTDLFLVLTCQRGQSRRSYLKLLQAAILWYALPYVLVLSTLLLRSLYIHLPKVPRSQPPAGALLPGFQLCPLPLCRQKAISIESPELFPPYNDSLRVRTRREYHGPRDDLPTFHTPNGHLTASFMSSMSPSWQQSQPERLPARHHTVPSILETQGHSKILALVAAGTFSHISNAYLITGHNVFPTTPFAHPRTHPL